MEQGGGELIRVADNGCGITVEELPLAVASHATSKIRQADDLFSVRTLGFRGEALASIAEVSRLILRSRTAEAASGAELEVVGGQSRPIAPVGCPIGTTIEVRNLFFNTPVRHKFLRSTQTEMGHTTEALTRLALAHPHVHFTLTHNSRLMHDLPPVDDVRQRIAAFFGQEIADDLIDVESESRWRDPHRLRRQPDAQPRDRGGCSTCSSTVGRSATARCSMRSAKRIAGYCSRAGNRSASCGSTCRRSWST